jgi:hypothetical protein
MPPKHSKTNMNLVALLMSAFKEKKGKATAANRSAVLIILVYCAYGIHALQLRTKIIETHLGITNNIPVINLPLIGENNQTNKNYANVP